MRRASAITVVPLPPNDALRLWTDVDRWSSFVEGFARRLSLSPEWPEKGARVVWESNPDGRGRVTETVTVNEPERFSTQVFEERLLGTQTFQVAPAGDGSEVALVLDYELTGHGPLRGLADTLFIRRALRDSLRRTLYRFEIEAEDEAGLRA
ncbi:MAG TPA: SRPBCC family protein [Thermoleophilaceae bacterium]|nr:SRPBCC family protein [Thermoleophilaceae bacterium]